MLKYAWISETGSRGINEDAVKVATVGNRHCFVICDGLGGHGAGDVASGTVADCFAADLFFYEDLSGFLAPVFERAQEKLLQKRKEANSRGKMKTTAVVFATDELNGYVGHVGDSRFYAFTADGRYIRTMDHSVPQALAQANSIREEEIRNHPSRNMLLKAMGERWDEPLYSLLAPFPVQAYCAYLLCSDGFWELIREEEMLRELAGSATPEQWLERMQQIIRKNGEGKSMDNYSAIAIFSR